MNESNNVLSFLQSKNIKMTINNEWFRDCCQFYVSSNPRRSMEEFQNFVYEQWLLADLEDLGEPCLPSYFLTFPKYKLDGKYAVQVNEITNIGESSYSQLKQIRSRDAISTFCESEEKVPAWQPKRSRTLRLSLTDGALKLFALEFEPIAALQEPFIPGLKILLIGPIECRRGVLLLTPKNIEILGGEVDSMLVANAPENVLARRLNLEENPNPLARIVSLQAPENEGTETESDVELDQYLQGFENSLEPSRVQNIIPVPEYGLGSNSRDCRNQPSTCREQRDISVFTNEETFSPNRPNSVTSVSDDRSNFNSSDIGNSAIGWGGGEDDSSIVSSNQIEMNSRDLANASMGSRNHDRFIPVANEQRISLDTHSRIDDSGNFSMDQRNQSKVPFVSEPRTSDMHSRMSACSNWLQSTTCANASRKEKSPIVGVVTPIPSNKRNAESPPFQMDAKSSKIDDLFSSHSTVLEVRKKDTVSVIQLEDLWQSQTSCSVKCVVRVTRLIHKPRIKNDKWLVVTAVADETGELNVTFDDEFLQERIFMMSACEIKSQKDKIAANSAVKDQIDELVRNGVVGLLELRGQFHIRIVPGNEFPVVMNVS